MLALTCPACATSIGAADRFCESCGAEQPPPEASSSKPPTPTVGCAGCSAPPSEIDADGYCGQCGMRVPPPRDHLELDRSCVAGVTDRGHLHTQNEDAMAFARTVDGDGGWIAVVADGVSTSQHPEQASQAAVDAACSRLAAALSDRSQPLAAAVDAAAHDALAAVRDVAWNPDRRDIGAPACTLAVAAWRPGEVLTVLSIGDARCYWFGADGANCCITDDDSWAAEQLAQGAAADDVAADDRAHAITRWLGVDAPPLEQAARPFGATTAGGQVLVCSDGLWNYAPGADDLRAHVVGDDLVTAARTAVQFANDAGGHDNITVVLATIPREGV